MENSEITKIQTEYLRLQIEMLKKRHERLIKRTEFITNNLPKILSLSMDGWPKTKQMKDYIKWLDIIYEAKVLGIYSIGTSNCDVIANINRFAKEISKH